MSKYQVDWFKWDVTLKDSTFRAYVAEPLQLDLEDPNSDKNDGEIFIKTIESFFNISSELKPFDLITFPEIFLPDEYLINFLTSFKETDKKFSCIHTGLRPSKKQTNSELLGSDNTDLKELLTSNTATNIDDSFLFSEDQTESLLKELKKYCDNRDIKIFEKWFTSKYKGKNEGKKLNLAVFLTKDSKNKIRICIHPKVVRSKYEFFERDEETMFEADCIQIVTLIEKTKSEQINIFPLTCSDILFKPYDNKQLKNVFDGLNDKDIKKISIENIDIVSVATCTPVSERNNIGTDNNYGKYTWKKEFRDIFSRSVKYDFYGKFKNSYFTLSNYFSSKQTPGLSGFFIPKEEIHLKPTDLQYLHFEIFSRPIKKLRKALSIELGATNEEGWMSIKYLNSNFKNNMNDAIGAIYGNLISIDINSNNKINLFNIKFQYMLKNKVQIPIIADKEVYEGTYNNSITWRKLI